MDSEAGIDDLSVFLNVPFDHGYERNFVALVSTLLALGRRPRCVLELPDLGEGRLSRIFRHIESCRISIHDLSRVGLPVRFNMPFELGLACALSTYKGRHSFVLLEKKPFRLDRTLSDIKGRDPLIHRGTPAGVITCVTDVLGSRAGDPTLRELRILWKRLWAYACDLKVHYRRDSLFHRTLFNELILGGTLLAGQTGLIAPVEIRR